MPLHLIKLCVGISSIEELEAWERQAKARHKKKNSRKPFVIDHVTRQMPKRREDIIAGGSLYWVINGQIACRRPIIDLQPVVRNGLPHCRIVMSAKPLRVHPRPFRPFQGWRYLKPDDAPPDLNLKLDKGLESLEIEFNRLGLIA